MIIVIIVKNTDLCAQANKYSAKLYNFLLLFPGVTFASLGANNIFDRVSETGRVTTQKNGSCAERGYNPKCSLYASISVPLLATVQVKMMFV